jgi:mannose-6-phosphate isomerase-like protein (cupin superfamily)
MRGEARTRVAHLRPADLLARLPGKAGERYYAAYRRGTLEVELYAPRGYDPQTPHERDEVYVVVSGSGEFVGGRERFQFGPGDFLFVAAGVAHRFENFTDDLAVWVLFYGPDGGEAVAP